MLRYFHALRLKWFFSLSLILAVWLALSTLSLAQGPTVTDTDPAINTIAAPLTTSLTITFSENISSATVNANSIIAQGMMGGLLTGTYTTNGSVVELTPSRALFPGELVRTSVVSAVQNITGTNATPYQWQFNAAAGPGPGEFPLTHTVTTAADYAVSVSAADVDGDGDLDLLSASGFDDKIAWYENDGAVDPSFTPHTVTTAADGVSSVSAADVDGDGDLDLLSASLYDYKIAWYENDGAADPSFITHTVTTAADYAVSVSAADVDGDGDLDLLSASSNDDKIAWYENDGATPPSFITHTLTTAADGAYSVSAADVDGDGDLDLLSASYLDDKIAWYENDGATPPSFITHTVTTAADYALSVSAADVDGDGDLDLLSASRNDDKIAWYENDGAVDPNFTSHIVTTAAIWARSVSAADVDGDGDLDLLSASFFDDKIAWYENDGAADPNFTSHIVTTATDGAYSVSAADVDGDGDLDLLSASSNNDKIAWYENTFTYSLDVSTVGSGTVTLDPANGPYPSGSTITATAIATAGWQFVSWSGDASGSVTETTVLMDADKVVTATFKPTIYLPILLK